MSHTLPNRELLSSSLASDHFLAQVLVLPPGEQVALLERLCEEHPDQADGLFRRYQLLREMGVPLDSPYGTVPERIGDFRLIERLGSGGMGVVYRAEQLSLGREVAFKVIRPEQMLFPRARDRFRREIEAIARLQHPGIVPVYTVGLEGELPWFAMELVRGCTLAEVLAALRGRHPESLSGADLLNTVCERLGLPAPSEPERLLPSRWDHACIAICRQVADALEHAHVRGILHRDVKPSNIVLTVEGRAMLLDFGLTTSTESERITQSSAAVGTLHYMPPEQLLGGTVDGRADVYALGVTLYELLSLQLPYEGRNRRTLERRIQQARPASIRARNTHVAPEAEQVCLHAMDPEPVGRYSRAEDFARDLRHVLEHRPIDAKPPGLLRRVRRWAQRQPGVAASLVGAFLLAAGIPTALYLQEGVYAEELEERIDRFDALNDFVVETFAHATPNVNEGRVVTASELVEIGLRRLGPRFQNRPRLKGALLGVFARVYRRMARPREGLAVANQAVDLYEGLSDVPATDRAEVLHEHALCSLAVGQGEQGEASYKAAIEIMREELGVEDWRVAELEVDLAAHYIMQVRLELAESILSRSMKPLLNAPPAELSRALHTRSMLCLARVQHSTSEEPKQDLREAEHLQREALELLESGPDGSLSTNYASMQMQLGLICREQNRLDEAEQHYWRGMEVFQAIYGRDTHYTASCMANLAGLLAARKDLGGAIEQLQRAVEIYDRSGVAHYTEAVMARSNLAGALSREGRYREASELYPTVIYWQEKVFGKHGEIYLYSSWLRLGDSRFQLGELVLAEEAFAEAVALFDRLVDSGQASGFSAAAQRWIEVLLDLGKVEAAGRVFEERLAAEEGVDPYFAGRLHAANGELEQAFVAFELSLAAHSEKKKSKVPAKLLIELARVCNELSRSDQALEHLQMVEAETEVKASEQPYLRKRWLEARVELGELRGEDAQLMQYRAELASILTD